MITQSMLDSIPDEWKQALEKSGGRRIEMVSDKDRQAIDAMIIEYYPKYTIRQIATACKRSYGYVNGRLLFLKDSGAMRDEI